MLTANDIAGSVFKNGSSVLKARIVDAAGDNVAQADVATIRYSVFELDPCRPNQLAPVEGHVDVSLAVGDVVFDTLQTGGAWTVDDVGYNFRHAIDVATDEAFPTAGATYQVRYEFTPVVGQKFIIRFQLRAI